MSPTVPKAVGDVLMSSYIGQGPKIDLFESEFGEFIGTDRDVLSVNSCTSALDLSLHLIGVKPGDEVLTTPITCTATNTVIVNRGAIPVWCDVDPMTGLIDPVDVRSKITSKTKAIMAVNWGGLPADYSHLKAFGLPVIEDAAHGPMTIESRNHGDYVCWSTQAIKFLTTGDGGMLLAPKDQIERARLLRWYGLDRRSSQSFRCEQNIKEAGYKYHMNDICAAIGLENIKHLEVILLSHKRNAHFYCRELQELSKITVLPYNDTSAYWIFTILVDHPRKFMQFLKERDIESSPVHARNDKHTGFYYPNGDLPGVDLFDAHQCSIPIGWWLDENDLYTVVDVIKEYDKSV